MAHQGEYIKKILKERKITQQRLADDIDVSRAQIIKLLSGPVLINDSIDTKSKLLDYLHLTDDDLPEPSIDELNKELLETRIGRDVLQWTLKNVVDKDKLINPDKYREQDLTYEQKKKIEEYESKSGVIYLGDIYDVDGNNKLTEISPGWWGMMVELVPEYAKAGYLSSYSDQEFIEELPKHYFTVDKFVRGKYRAFEITGDSMDNGKIEEAIPDGSIVLCRELKRDAWKSKLHSHKWPNWIFVHRYEGIICKQIANQDVQNGILTLKSLNPDKDRYPEIKIQMDELEQIYNVVLRQLK